MDNAKVIYLIRHGQTEYNRLGMIQGQGIDQSLNETGLKQAQLFYDLYQDVPFELVFYSTLRRTAETVSGFLAKSIPYISTPDLNEISWGIYEGRVRDQEITLKFQRLMAEWGRENYHYAWEGAESAHELDKRVSRFIDSLVGRVEKTILVCSHGRTMRCLLTRMLSKPLMAMEQFDHDNTGLFLLNYHNQEFKLVKTNDISHLEGADL